MMVDLMILRNLGQAHLRSWARGEQLMQPDAVAAARGPGGGMAGQALTTFHRPRHYRGLSASARPLTREKARLPIVWSDAGSLGARLLR